MDDKWWESEWLRTKSGKLIRSLFDMIGRKFGRLLVLKQVFDHKQKGKHWLCRCDCGVEKVVRGSHMANGRIQSCSCLNRERVIERTRKEPYRCLHTILLRGARQRGVQCNLSFEEFVSFTKFKECHYCGRPLVWQPHIRHGETNACNLDRKDNSMGYSADNCVPCCRLCNYIKSDKFTYAEMLEIGRSIKAIMAARPEGYA